MKIKSVIIEEYNFRKNSFHRRINEKIRSINEKYKRSGLTKQIENFIKNAKFTKKNMNNTYKKLRFNCSP